MPFLSASGAGLALLDPARRAAFRSLAYAESHHAIFAKYARQIKQLGDEPSLKIGPREGRAFPQRERRPEPEDRCVTPGEW